MSYIYDFAIYMRFCRGLSGMIKKIKMLTKKLSQTLARDYFFVIFAWSLRQRVHLHHETFGTNSSLEKGGVSIETAWCVA